MVLDQKICSSAELFDAVCWFRMSCVQFQDAALWLSIVGTAFRIFRFSHSISRTGIPKQSVTGNHSDEFFAFVYAITLFDQSISLWEFQVCLSALI